MSDPSIPAERSTTEEAVLDLDQRFETFIKVSFYAVYIFFFDLHMTMMRKAKEAIFNRVAETSNDAVPAVPTLLKL